MNEVVDRALNRYALMQTMDEARVAVSVARDIFAKSVMNTSNSIAKAETTNLPVTTKAMATNAAFRIVRLSDASLMARRSGQTPASPRPRIAAEASIVSGASGKQATVGSDR